MRLACAGFIFLRVLDAAPRLAGRKAQSKPRASVFVIWRLLLREKAAAIEFTAGSPALAANLPAKWRPFSRLRLIGGAVSGAFGSEAYFNPYADLDFNGTFVINGSAASAGSGALVCGQPKWGSPNQRQFRAQRRHGGERLRCHCLFLWCPNTYTGGTAVNAGTLLVNNTSGSGTGPGAVTANTSTLGGTGIIAGTVTMGSSGPGAFLSPGNVGIGKLTIKKMLKLNQNATHNCELDSNTITADEVVDKSVTVINGALIALSDIGTGLLPIGTVFTLIDNLAATPITGVFSNLASGSTFTLGGNNYQVSYTGGTGNDLTLTIVP